MPPQPLLKALPAMFDAKQPAVRDAVKKLMVGSTFPVEMTTVCH